MLFLTLLGPKSIHTNEQSDRLQPQRKAQISMRFLPASCTSRRRRAPSEVATQRFLRPSQIMVPGCCAVAPSTGSAAYILKSCSPPSAVRSTLQAAGYGERPRMKSLMRAVGWFQSIRQVSLKILGAGRSSSAGIWDCGTGLTLPARISCRVLTVRSAPKAISLSCMVSALSEGNIGILS